MSHASFGTVRSVEVEREPITFDFGLYAEEVFRIIPDPTLGDTLDLYDAPEPDPENELESVALLARFIRRMLNPDDVARFDAALYRIPASHCHVVIDAAAWIAEQATPFRRPPADTSSVGRRRTGTTSKKRSAGKRR